VNDHAPLIERAFTLDVVETRDAPTAVDGHVPPYVRGTALLNGPGRFSRAGLQYRHWLDGDGLLAALRFDGGGPRFSSRFVRSEKFVREEAEGRPVFRTFGTAFDGDELKRGIGLVSPVNVSVYPVAGRLLAFGEQGLPWEVDPDTLETRGVHTFDGQLNEITPFSAHPKIDYGTGEMFNFGVSFSPQQPIINLFRFAADGGLTYRRRHALPYPSSIHDFAISGRYVAVWVSPLVVRMDVLLQPGRTLMDAMTWEPERGSFILIMARDTGDLVATLEAGRRHCLHLVNAFDRGRELVLDVIEFEKPLYPEYQVIPHLFTDTFRGGPVRLVLDPALGTVVERQEIAYRCSPDFPAHDPDSTARSYEHFWMLGISRAGQPGRKFFDQLVRVDWGTRAVEVYQAPAGQYLGGEPMFVPDPSSAGRGAVMCQVFDARNVASSFAVFDAFRLGAGPVAVVRLDHPVPLLFHSMFVRR
jgi:all-trans-8'-apo-beta-carotenal 15,15'-oxygenase